MNWKVLLGLFGANLIYLILGGIMFHLIEESYEDKTREATRVSLDNFLQRYECLSRDEMEDLIRVVIYAYDNGVIASDNASSSSNWDIFSSIFFSATIVTTIGYGHISPSSTGGRAACVVYAIIGIPLMLVMLGGIGEKVLMVPEKLTKKIHYLQKKTKLSRLVHVLSMLLVGVVLFLLVPAAIFTAVEDWRYGEAFYYAFISISTIGFGDFVAGQNLDDDTPGRGIYRICLCVWLVVGLAWLASIISAIQQLITSLIGRVEERVDRNKRQPKDDLKMSGESDSPPQSESTLEVEGTKMALTQDTYRYKGDDLTISVS